MERKHAKEYDAEPLKIQEKWQRQKQGQKCLSQWTEAAI